MLHFKHLFFGNSLRKKRINGQVFFRETGATNRLHLSSLGWQKTRRNLIVVTCAINGLGRIGKLALRFLLENGNKIAFLNDKNGTPEMLSHLLEFDTVHGR